MISAAKRDVVFAVLLRCLTLCSAGIICLICVFVGRESWAAFDSPTDAGDRTFELAHLFTDDAWNPANRQFNLLPMIFGSLLATFGSALLAAPLGIGVAIFLNYYAPNKFGWFVRRLVEIMASVPSVVYGLWGLSVLVPLIASISPIEQGQSLLAGILILTFMTIPPPSLWLPMRRSKQFHNIKSMLPLHWDWAGEQRCGRSCCRRLDLVWFRQ